MTNKAFLEVNLFNQSKRFDATMEHRKYLRLTKFYYDKNFRLMGFCIKFFYEYLGKQIFHCTDFVMACTRHPVPGANKQLQYQNLKGNAVDSYGSPPFQKPFMLLKCLYPTKISFIRSGLMQIAYIISLLYQFMGQGTHSTQEAPINNLFKK